MDSCESVTCPRRGGGGWGAGVSQGPSVQPTPRGKDRGVASAAGR